MEKLQQLVGELATKIKELAGRQAEWTAEDRANWDAVNTDYDAAKAKLDDAQKVAQRTAEVEASLVAPIGDQRIGREDFDGRIRNAAATITEEQRALGQQSWFMVQAGFDPTQRHLDAARLCGINPRSRELTIRLRDNREYRAGMSTTDNVGGYTIPEGFVNNFELALLAYGGIRQAADVIRTATGNNLPWPTGNDTSNEGELLTEETTIGATVNPSVGVKTFYAYKMSSKLIQISPELLQDSAFDMASQIGTWLGERIGRIESSYYTTGTGSSQPTGILAASGGATVATLSTGVAYTASATAITWDELTDLIYSVDASYRPGSAYMMHDNIIRYLRKLMDGEGHYYWQPSITAGINDQILGYPVITNLSMSSTITAGDKTVVFGQLKKFKIRDVAEVRLRRLDERYADTDQIGFVAFHRTDSGLLDAGTHPVKYLLQHA